MSLFKKKEKLNITCNCTTEAVKNKEQENQKCTVKILGGGCAKCNQLEAATIEALKELNMDTLIEHIKDYADIASYGVMTTPALVVDGKVASYGKVLTKEQVIKLLKEIRG